MAQPNLVVPYFAAAPSEYDQGYMAQVTRAFSVYAAQLQNPGPIRGSDLNLTNLPTYADNASAVTGGLSLNTVYKTATGEIRIVV